MTDPTNVNPNPSRRDLLKGAAAALPLAALGACATGARQSRTPPPDTVLSALPIGGGVDALAPVTVRPAAARGHADHGWLDTKHTFSFASYYDPAHMGFRALRVINEDVVQPGQGFPTHPHRDMEILTYVLDGALEHKDSMGNGGVIVPTEVQRMSAGTGIFHSEYNPSGRERVHFMQIWIQPDRNGVKPGYAQKVFPMADRRGGLRLVASPDGRDGSIAIHASTNLYASILETGKTLTHQNPAGRGTWLQVARGSLDLNGRTLSAGDGASTSDAGALHLTARQPSEFLLFDLA